MPQIDWDPICQYVNNPPILVDGKCGECRQRPFVLGGDYVCAQCGTRWGKPDFAPIAYRDWSTRSAEGLPVMDRLRSGLGIYR